jgi:glutathione S-transferase
MHVYQSEGPPNSRRVRIFLTEKGPELTLVAVDLEKR